MRWDEFATACPEIAARGEERLRQHELCLLGTIRRDGWPRISPVEPDFVDGELMIGMMWQSLKARDLVRDARCTLHSVVSNRNGTEGDFKLHGAAVDVREAERRDRYRDTIFGRIGWAPDEPTYHLFAIDVQAAGFVIFGDEPQGLAWTPEDGLRRFAVG
jgi:hypothetical protein